MTQQYQNLSGKVLVATPYAMKGNIFHKSVIYVAHHDPESSMGIIVNHSVSGNTSILSRILTQGQKGSTDAIRLGGPMEPERGFFIHTDDYDKNLLFHNPEIGLAVSSNQEIMANIQTAHGPSRYLFVAGYTGWVRRQMEEEIEENLWLVVEPDLDIIFAENDSEKWFSFISKLGVNASQFVVNYTKC